jgi:hypothetical protein
MQREVSRGQNSDRNYTHIPTHASVTLRGKTVPFRAWSLSDVARARADFVAVSQCTDLFAPDVFPSVLRILALSISDYFTGVSLQTLADELADTLHPVDLMTIVPVVFDADAQLPFAHKEPAHGIH